MTNELTNERLREIAESSAYPENRMLAAELLDARKAIDSRLLLPGIGEALPMARFGIRWSGISRPLVALMDDGYWTPWHFANTELGDRTKERDAARAEVDRLSARLADVERQRDEARGVVARVVEIIDGADGGVPASAADVWNLCDKWRHQWVMEAKAIAPQPPAEKAEGGA